MIQTYFLLKKQIEKLNNITMELLVPTVIQGLVHQIKFINDYNNVRSQPLDLPISSKRKNALLKPLSMDTFNF